MSQEKENLQVFKIIFGGGVLLIGLGLIFLWFQWRGLDWPGAPFCLAFAIIFIVVGTALLISTFGERKKKSLSN